MTLKYGSDRHPGYWSGSHLEYGREKHLRSGSGLCSRCLIATKDLKGSQLPYFTRFSLPHLKRFSLPYFDLVYRPALKSFQFNIALNHKK
jgi:hypothetical protein